MQSENTKLRYIVKKVKKTDPIIRYNETTSNSFKDFKTFYNYCLNERDIQHITNESSFFVKLLATVHSEVRFPS